MDGTQLGREIEAILPDVRSYLARLVIRPEIADELAQAAAVRALESVRPPAESGGVRPWIFRIATNLALDHFRSSKRWRELSLIEARTRAEGDPAFVAASDALRGTPEVAAIAREHLAVCLSCVLRNVAVHEAAALLLVEAYGFTVAETAEILESRFAQVKGWVQSARATLTARYEKTCALLRKEGVCYQCVELDGYFNGASRNPLAGVDAHLETDARLRVLRELPRRSSEPWHRLLLRIVDPDE